MKRQKIQIIHAILATIQKKGGSAGPTHILYKANLSHAMMEEYLQDLSKKELITITQTERSRKINLTNNAYTFLEKYNEISSFMDTFGIE